MWGSFARSVAIRHLRYGIAQTLLTMGVVAISVTLIIFISALIRGVQRQFIQTVTGAIPQIVVQLTEREPLTPWTLRPDQIDDRLYRGAPPTLEERRTQIEDWREWTPQLEAFDPTVVGVSPVVEGNGFLTRGERRVAVRVTGVIPERHDEVVEIEGRLEDGRFFGLRPGEVSVGWQIAEDLNLSVGDRVRITSDEGVTSAFTVAGIFNTGFELVDSVTVFVPLGDAQSLFGLGRAVTSIAIRLSDVFAADEIARRMELRIPYEAQSWMTENQALLQALRTQTQTTRMIVIFLVIAAGFGIASILFTSVTSKLREIGILKAIGATQKQIVGIFTLESTLMAALGGVIGVLFGVGLSLGVYQYRLATAIGRPEDVFPVALDAQILLGSFAVALGVGFFASLYPAWRASKINPIEVIRGL